MEHCTKKGESKILEQCTLPLTGKGVVDVIVTELAVLRVTEEGLVLDEIMDGANLERVQEKTEAIFKISPNFK